MGHLHRWSWSGTPDSQRFWRVHVTTVPGDARTVICGHHANAAEPRRRGHAHGRTGEAQQHSHGAHRLPSVLMAAPAAWACGRATAAHDAEAMHHAVPADAPDSGAEMIG